MEREEQPLRSPSRVREPSRKDTAIGGCGERMHERHSGQLMPRTSAIRSPGSSPRRTEQMARLILRIEPEPIARKREIGHELPEAERPADRLAGRWAGVQLR